MIKKVFYFLFFLFFGWGLLLMFIDYSGLSEFLVYGLVVPVGLIFFFANKNRILSYLNTDILSIFMPTKENVIKTIDYFSFNPFSPSPKKWEISYKDGKFDGLAIQWYKNGNKRDETNWKIDKKHGLDTVWDENGNILQEGSWKSGKQDGEWTMWHENGQKEQEGNYKDGKLDGKWTTWHENGQKKLELNYKDGKLDGKWTMWHENGQKELEGNYKDGVCISGDC